MTTGEHGEAVTSNRDTLAAWFENHADVDWDDFSYEEWADALMPTVEAMLAQARAEVVAAVEALANTFIAAGTVSVYESAREIGEMILAAVSGTDHDTTLDTVRAEALRDAAVEIPGFTSNEGLRNVGEVRKWLRARADRIAPDDTPSERGGET